MAVTNRPVPLQPQAHTTTLTAVVRQLHVPMGLQTLTTLEMEAQAIVARGRATQAAPKVAAHVFAPVQQVRQEQGPRRVQTAWLGPTRQYQGQQHAQL